MNKPCSHGTNLPRGLKCDRGYLCIRLKRPKFYKGCGPHTRDNEERATIEIIQIRRQIRDGIFEVKQKMRQMSFKDVAQSIYLPKWKAETYPDGRPRHTRASMQTCEYIINGSLVPAFGNLAFHEVRGKHVIEWREARLKSVLGTTVNREQNVLQSIYSHVMDWIKTEQIKGFKVPDCNPCDGVEKAALRKRTRSLSTSELGQLKAACLDRNDSDMWEICKMALKAALRKKDLEKLETGLEIDTIQAKTQRPIKLPLQVMSRLNFVAFRDRWEAARKDAGLEFPKEDPRNVEFRDLRRTGANLLKQKGYSTKLISEVLGHASEATTEIYLTKNVEHLKPLMNDLKSIVDAI